MSVFIPRFDHLKELCQDMVATKIGFLLDSRGPINISLPDPTEIYREYKISNLQPERGTEVNASPVCEPEIVGDAMPFSGTLFIYSENEPTEIELALLKDFARTKGVNLRYRGPSFAKERSFRERPVAFISYDSKDREDVARPLAQALQRKFCPVWFDEFALGVGDSLRDKIESGLKETKKCIVILSPNFLANKRWSKREFDSIFSREIIEEQNVFLPVWHSVTVKDVYEYSPSLSNRKGILWSLGIDEVVRQLYRKINEEVELPTADFNL